jgi:hypothetical protein
MLKRKEKAEEDARDSKRATVVETYMFLVLCNIQCFVVLQHNNSHSLAL